MVFPFLIMKMPIKHYFFISTELLGIFLIFLLVKKIFRLDDEQKDSIQKIINVVKTLKNAFDQRFYSLVSRDQLRNRFNIGKMISNGIPVLIVSKIPGHSKPSVTMNIYAHASVEMQSEAANLMENLVTPIPFSLYEDQKQEISR